MKKHKKKAKRPNYHGKAYHINNLRKAVVMSLNEIKRIGTSKYEERKKYNAVVRATMRENGATEEEINALKRFESPYIHSCSTFGQYITIGLAFVDWVAKAHPKANKLSYMLEKRYPGEYIQERIDRGLSAWTIARDRSALAKLFRVSGHEILESIPKRSSSNITRSRNYNESMFMADVEKHGNIAQLLKATGVRRFEFSFLYPEYFYTDSNNNVSLRLDGKIAQTKGGKARDIPIIDENQERIREILSLLPPGEPICPNPPSGLDIHGIRSMYTKDFYFKIARNTDDISADERVFYKHPKKDYRHPGHFYYSAPGIYRRRRDGAVFDRRALLIISQALGHERVNVIVTNYLW